MWKESFEKERKIEIETEKKGNGEIIEKDKEKRVSKLRKLIEVTEKESSEYERMNSVTKERKQVYSDAPKSFVVV